MKKEELFNIIGEVDEQKAAAAGMAMNTKKKSRPVWVKWGAMAACLCLVVVCALTIPNLQNETPHGQGTMVQVYTLPQAETMSVELVKWGVDSFKGVVVDAGDNSIFPADAELSVVFDYDTEILLNDGTVMVFNPDEPDTGAIGWKEGTIVTVKFVNYEEYIEDNHFYNHAYKVIFASKLSYGCCRGRRPLQSGMRKPRTGPHRRFRPAEAKNEIISFKNQNQEADFTKF